MNPKEVKIGETFKPLRFDTIIRIHETAPKYDPCRKFRKGDMVRVVEWNGRDIARVGEIGHVVSDEHNCRVEIAIDGWKKEVYYPACHLKLIIPVEEGEPYFIEETSNGYRLMKRNGELLANYWENHPYAKEAAEAECARLNAEYRQSTINNQQ